MKKTYVKPVMESEAFVANEYVAACWGVACLGQEQVSSGWPIASDGLHEEHGILFKGMQSKLSTSRHNIYNVGDLIRTRHRSDSPQGYTYNGVDHWGVDVRDFATAEHPNASN